MFLKRLRFLLVLFPVMAVAETAPPPTDPPHVQMPGADNTGAIEGSLFLREADGKKTPLAGQKITMIVFRGDQQVLVLDKSTDESGGFHFKNIFRDPSFTYGFGLMYGEDLYIYPAFSLAPTETVKTIEFPVGQDSPYRQDMEALRGNMAPEGAPTGMPSQATARATGATQGDWQKPFRTVTIALMAIVVLTALYFAARRPE